jgi:hypothetical protein
VNSSIKHFVRHDLGCGCPDEVFETIDVQYAPSGFAGLPGDCLIVIGTRLLVLLIVTVHWPEVSRNLESLVNRGRELRDGGSFNRFRIVLATPEPTAAQAALMEQFGDLPSLDDRVHLHIIAADGLPAALHPRRVNR